MSITTNNNIIINIIRDFIVIIGNKRDKEQRTKKRQTKLIHYNIEMSHNNYNVIKAGRVNDCFLTR